VKILGIVNLTRDSFSDGGRFLDTQAALAHAAALRAAGADVLDLGAESTHPDAEDVSADEELERLLPVIRALHADGVTISVDTYKPVVMEAVLAEGAAYINDVSGLRDPASVAVLRDSEARIILMHSTAHQARAERRDVPADEIVPRIIAFFRQRIAELADAGIEPARLILDPGMGFFLGSTPEPSLAVLRELPALLELGHDVCISTSRKSFLGTVSGGQDAPRPVDQRGPATLASELWAATQGAGYIRTHDVAALHDAWRIWNSIASRPTGP
jgi:dihydropteroate synthase type 2